MAKKQEQTEKTEQNGKYGKGTAERAGLHQTVTFVP